jgi:dipeptidyl aminopeptidase/acylaminoacyl peptidase
LDAIVQALIEEARRRARRRRLVFASLVGAAILAGVGVFVVFDRTARLQGSSRGASARPAATAAATKSRIAFYSTRTRTGPSQGGAVYVVDADGGGKRQLTRTAWMDRPEVASGPAWSPDGRRIAFLSVRHRNEDVYVLDLGSGQAHRVTRHPADDREPAWSPAGRKIAFVSERFHGPSGYSYDLYVINADGSGERRLTHDLLAASYPAWSPDGRKIVFAVWSNGIYVVNAEAKPRDLCRERRRNRAEAADEQPSLGPGSPLVARREDDRLRDRPQRRRRGLRHEPRRKRPAECQPHPREEDPGRRTVRLVASAASSGDGSALAGSRRERPAA